jgi:hypothetical protein
MKTRILLIFTAYILLQCSSPVSNNQKWPENIQIILDNTTELKYDNGNRLPLYLWPAIDPGDLSAADAEKLVREFDKRGLGIICSWSMEDSAKVMSRSITIAHAQKKLGQLININASDLMYSFFNGDESTAHIDVSGKPFFDTSFGDHKMGCPFALDERKKEIRKHIDQFVMAYKDAGLPVGFIFTDWEVDGPLEVNRAFDASSKCTICQRYLGRNITFPEFQKKMREIRSYLENYALSEPVLSQFPHALVGNYAVYPNDGYRYWYDYFEYYVDGQPCKEEQKAKYRKWYNDFPLTGFTFAMPVVYPWSGIYNWYNFENRDYRWFYNMLLNASNAGKSTPQSVPVISFIHWHTIFEGSSQDSTIHQLSKENYQELLWHMLLRGTDAFFMWSQKDEFPEEVKFLHEVYADAQKFGRFLEQGIPVTFDVPDKPGPVISGLILGDSLLVRRTDFSSDHDTKQVFAGTRLVTIDYNPGACSVIPLK